MDMSTTYLENINDVEDIIGLVREFMHIGAKLSMGAVLGPFRKFDLLW